MNAHAKSAEFDGLTDALDNAVQQYPDKRPNDDKIEHWRRVGRILIDELNGAAVAGETISSVPAFLEAELRRRFSRVYPIHPEKIDTNDRYRDLVKELIKLSTASLILPIFFLRNIVFTNGAQQLLTVLNQKAYWSWACLALSILFGILFCYFSGKWVRKAWGGEVYLFKLIPLSENFLEGFLDVSLLITMVGFMAGMALILWFVLTFHFM